jgi:sulfotransferase family protein
MKIFCIGMPKTGTVSLHDALVVLGYKSVHFPHDEKTLAELEAGIYHLSILNEVDALSDIPIPAIFAQLDEVWPNSKFIYTDRAVDSWLDSCEHAPFNQPGSEPGPGTFRYFYRAMLYGCIHYNRNRFEWVYRNHKKTVLDYFEAEKRDQLLVMNFSSGDGWKELCEFLGVSIPDVDFPHSNTRPVAENSERSLKDKVLEKLKLAR